MESEGIQMSQRLAGAISVASGLCSGIGAYLLVLQYEAWVETWHQGAVALGWGPFQLFYADVVPRLAASPSIRMGMGWGVITDPVVLGYVLYWLLSRRRRRIAGY